MAVVVVGGRRAVRGPIRQPELYLELLADPGYMLRNPVTGPDVVVRAVMHLGQDEFKAETIISRDLLFDTKVFDYTVEGVLAQLFVEKLIPQMIAQLKDEYIEAVQSGKFALR